MQKLSEKQNISFRISMLRFPLIVGVVFIHNYSTSDHMEGFNPEINNAIWFRFAHLVISEGLARVAVPLFFITAGYLFFVGLDNYASYVTKIRRRFWSLLVPFLFWNIATLLIYGAGETFRPTSRLFSSTVRFYVPGFHFLDYINAIFGLWSSPMAYQFWFIRDLMALDLLVPIIWLACKYKCGLPLLALLFGCYCARLWPPIWPSVGSAPFFCLGCYLSFKKARLSAFDPVGPLMLVLFASALTCDVWFYDHPFEPYLHRAMVVIGVPAAWWVTSLIANHARRFGTLVAGLGGASFFVFAAHEPLLTILWKLTFKRFAPMSGSFFFVLFLLIPMVLITALVLIHRLLKKAMPRSIALVTGEWQGTRGPRAEAPVETRQPTPKPE